MIAATIIKYMQVTPDYDFEKKKMTKVLNEDTTISELMNWAKFHLGKEATISDIMFSEITE